MTTHNPMLVVAYRSKAAEALELARQARQDGRQAAHAGYLSEVCFWNALAEAMAHGAGEITQEVTDRQIA